MKTTLLILIAVVTTLFASACSSGVRVGTKHHHVSVGGSAG